MVAAATLTTTAAAAAAAATTTTTLTTTTTTTTTTLHHVDLNSAFQKCDDALLPSFLPKYPLLCPLKTKACVAA